MSPSSHACSAAARRRARNDRLPWRSGADGWTSGRSWTTPSSGAPRPVAALAGASWSASKTVRCCAWSACCRPATGACSGRLEEARHQDGCVTSREHQRRCQSLLTLGRPETVPGTLSDEATCAPSNQDGVPGTGFDVATCVEGPWHWPIRSDSSRDAPVLSTRSPRLPPPTTAKLQAEPGQQWHARCAGRSVEGRWSAHVGRCRGSSSLPAVSVAVAAPVTVRCGAHLAGTDFSTHTVRISRMASAALAIHSRETHSLTEWKFCPPPTRWA